MGMKERIWEYGILVVTFRLELAHERSTGHGHSGYKAYAVDLGTGDDANTSKFEYMFGK